MNSKLEKLHSLQDQKADVKRQISNLEDFEEELNKEIDKVKEELWEMGIEI
ncbi:hypothetical protein BAOM_2961 [Peribacillus asahii]|uniref:Uncharacterized protein n=1 Tax=Peribacillus asahii TaxID=228899 RepID=A0A3Q9RNG9_9BACI|nr:hypothetical protein [Peribacillus asahii]AZV43570.1 hypothetical protein BAOM_2961 [Peribacillus asahii]